MTMTGVQVVKEENSCEHCGRSFVREATLLKHLCEQKRRWLDKDKVANRLAYGAWKSYFNRHHPNKKSTEYRDFIKSNYYTAFIKFGIYCSDVGVVNPASYGQWLVKNSVPIDTWGSDRNYSKYLVEYLRSEDPLDAVKRTLDVLLDMAQTGSIRLCDIFRYGNRNKLLHLITSGKISPWVLYQCDTGQEFLGTLDTNQTNLIYEYIDPPKWNIKFKKSDTAIQDVKTVLSGVGL